MDCSRSLEVLAKMGVLVLVLIFALFRKSSATVVVIGNNISLAFDDIEANFAPAVKGSGACGILQVAEPFDACTSLTKEAVNGKGIYSPFALIIRGSCTFEKKVRNAQKAGFAAAIIYNNDDSSDLVSMAGNADGIHIYAVFVSKAAGEMLASFVGMSSMEFWIIPSYENTAWSAMAIAFISLLAVCAVLATCFFVRRHRLRHVRRRGRHVREFHGMSGRLVKALPSMVFSSVVDEKGTSETCAICLEDYVVGDKLRVLPCQHNFHLACIDSWLTNWRTFCPVCKRDARTSTGEPPASESTPLLSPVSSSAMSAPISSLVQSESRQSSFTGSPAMYIPNSHATSSYVISYSGPSRGGASSYFPPSASSSCLTPDSSRNSINIRSSSALYHHHSERTLNLPYPFPFTRHSLESHMINTSPPMSSPSFTSRYMSSYVPGSCSASPQVSILNGRPPRIPSYSASAMPSFAESVSGASPFASTRSLPGVS